MKRVLLVDDQPRWRNIFKTLLKNGFNDLEIQECSSREDALQILENHVFDLAILDLRLIDDCSYDVQGLSLMREVQVKSPITKVILTTAYPTQLGEGYQEADAFILKVPTQGLFDIQLFQKTVDHLLNPE